MAKFTAVVPAENSRAETPIPEWLPPNLVGKNLFSAEDQTILLLAWAALNAGPYGTAAALGQVGNPGAAAHLRLHRREPDRS